MSLELMMSCSTYVELPIYFYLIEFVGRDNYLCEIIAHDFCLWCAGGKFAPLTIFTKIL